MLCSIEVLLATKNEITQICTLKRKMGFEVIPHYLRSGLLINNLSLGRK